MKDFHLHEIRIANAVSTTKSMNGSAVEDGNYSNLIDNDDGDDDADDEEKAKATVRLN